MLGKHGNVATGESKTSVADAYPLKFRLFVQVVEVTFVCQVRLMDIAVSSFSLVFYGRF